MDLFAYSQIDNLEDKIEAQGIVVPRLRGYRLMKNEKAISKEDIKQRQKDDEVDICKSLIESDWLITNWSEWSERTRRNCRKYLYNEFEVRENFKGEEYIHDIPVGIKWNKIHGKRRKNLKWEIKKNNKAVKEQFDMFNKYVGRDDVLMIHARIGGINDSLCDGLSNWYYYGGEKLREQPWFLNAVDDAEDGTYCDIYAKINMEDLKNEI